MLLRLLNARALVMRKLGMEGRYKLAGSLSRLSIFTIILLIRPLIVFIVMLVAHYFYLYLLINLWYNNRFSLSLVYRCGKLRLVPFIIYNQLRLLPNKLTVFRANIVSILHAVVRDFLKSFGI